jgi:hypothetical protein
MPWSCATQRQSAPSTRPAPCARRQEVADLEAAAGALEKAAETADARAGEAEREASATRDALQARLRPSAQGVCAFVQLATLRARVQTRRLSVAMEAGGPPCQSCLMSKARAATGGCSALQTCACRSGPLRVPGCCTPTGSISCIRNCPGL